MDKNVNMEPEYDRTGLTEKKSRLETFQDSYNVLRRIDREKLLEGKGSYNLPYLLICFILIGVCFIIVVFQLIKIFS